MPVPEHGSANLCEFSRNRSFKYPSQAPYRNSIKDLRYRTHEKETVPQLKPDAAVYSAYNVYQFRESRIPGKECVSTSTPHVSSLSLPRKERVTSAFLTSTRTRASTWEGW